MYNPKKIIPDFPTGVRGLLLSLRTVQQIITVMNTDSSTPRKLPVGIQSFEKLRSEGFVYVDKTALIYKLTQAGVPCFLSRPRRFGKSLLLSTIEAYFKGKRELFHGLAIEKLEQNWHEYPVLHLSLNAEKYDSKERLADMLERQLQTWEQLYQTDGKGITYSGRFMTVIKQAYEQTGRRVVVLIDEYDKPLLRSFDTPKLQDEFRETLTAFYTVLKDADPWLQFVLITGVTKFAQMGIFSNLNQLSDISFDLDYNTLCGMTLPEIEATFAPELEAMAQKQKLSHQALLEKLTRLYDGYRFTDDEEFTQMYNPFSVLSALMKRSFGSYWFSSGTPTFLVDMLKKTDFDLREMDGIEVGAASLSAYTADANNLVPILYQSGYLTIKEYDDRFQIYTLGFPNEEVKSRIDEKGYLLPYTADGRRLVKVGVSFDKEKRNLGEWLIERF